MFRPENLVSVSKLAILTVINTLDKEFETRVREGWYSEWHRDRIYLQFDSGNQYGQKMGQSLIAYRTEIEQHYLDQGWGKVEIATSGESGERDGLVKIQLYKEAGETKTTLPSSLTFDMFEQINLIKSNLISMTISRSDQQRFTQITDSLAELENLARKLLA